VFFWQCLRSEHSHSQNRRFKRFFMHQATLPLPSDNKPVLGCFKSLCGCLLKPSDNARRSGQQIRADQATSSHRSPQAAPAAPSWPPITGHHSTQATSWPPQHLQSLKTQQNQGKIDDFLRENQPLLMTLCPSLKKSIIQLFHYCIYPVILYKTTVILEKNGSYTHVQPPPTQKFRPPFFNKGDLQIYHRLN
jgi:hypothetical protein